MIVCDLFPRQDRQWHLGILRLQIRRSINADRHAVAARVSGLELDQISHDTNEVGIFPRQNDRPRGTAPGQMLSLLEATGIRLLRPPTG